MSFDAMFTVSELCEKESPSSGLSTLSGNRLWKQKASCFGSPKPLFIHWLFPAILAEKSCLFT